MTDFAIIFGSIIGASILITWGIAFACRIKNVYHYCRYKVSQDYERLWDLILTGHNVISIAPDYDSDGKLRRIWPHEIRMYTNTHGEEFIMMDAENLKNPSMKEFIGYCQYKNVKYLDFITDGCKIEEEIV